MTNKYWIFIMISSKDTYLGTIIWWYLYKFPFFWKVEIVSVHSNTFHLMILALSFNKQTLTAFSTVSYILHLDGKQTWCFILYLYTCYFHCDTRMHFTTTDLTDFLLDRIKNMLLCIQSCLQKEFRWTILSKYYFVKTFYRNLNCKRHIFFSLHYNLN